MKTQHTKGEWQAGKPNKDTWLILSEGSFICMLPTKEKNATANAKLIAASPALLTEAQKLIDNIKDYLSDVEDVNSIIPINALCEVIKKATE
jgi:hypothetical protein